MGCVGYEESFEMISLRSPESLRIEIHGYLCRCGRHGPSREFETHLAPPAPPVSCPRCKSDDESRMRLLFPYDPRQFPPRGKLGRCKWCGQPVYWCKTKDGKGWIPINGDHVSHWKTCPNAKEVTKRYRVRRSAP